MTRRPPFLDEPTPDLGSWFDTPSVETWQAAAARTRSRPDAATTLPDGFSHPAFLFPETEGASLGRVAPLARHPIALGLVDHGDLASVRDAVEQDLGLGLDGVWIVPDGRGRGLARPTEGAAVRAVDLPSLLRHVTLTDDVVVLEGGVRATAWFRSLLDLTTFADVQPAELRGAVFDDLPGVLARTGSLPASLANARKDQAARVRLARRDAPKMRVVGLSSLAFAEAGAYRSHEIGILLAGLVELLRDLDALELPPEEVLPHLTLRLSMGTHGFVDIATLRALRAGVARVLEVCGVAPEARSIPIHAVTAAHLHGTRDVWSNTLRNAQGAFAAAVGGADMLTIVPHDRVLGVPTARARRLAATTHDVLAREAHLAWVDDAAGGSHHVERLTRELVEAAWGLLQDIEGQGGLFAALRSSHVSQLLASARAATSARVGRRRPMLVGINAFVTEEVSEPRPEVPATAVDSDPVVEATALPSWRPAEAWEALQARSDLVAEHLGRRPRIALLGLGAPAAHRGRLEWARAFLEPGGFDTVVVRGSWDRTRVPADGVCLCGTDDAYDAELTERARAHADAAFVAVASPPRDDAPDGLVFVHRRADALATLSHLLDATEAP